MILLPLLLLQKGSEFAQDMTGRHATPTGALDYLVVAISVVVVVISFGLLVRYFLRPEQPEQEHIKNRILDDEPSGKPTIKS